MSSATKSANLFPLSSYVKTNRTAYVFLFLYLATKPFYLFDSGLPQIADIFGCILFAIILFSKGNLSKEYMGILLLCALFSAYSVALNIFHYLLIWDTSTVKTGFFYAYNTAILYTILKLGNKDENFVKIFMAMIILSCLIQIPMSSLVMSDAARQTLFFNNPNQFSYWVLLSATLYSICAKRAGVRIGIQLLLWPFFCFFLALGLSKAAIIATCLLAAIHFSRRASHTIMFMIFSGVLVIGLQGSEISTNVFERLEGIGEQEDDSIMGRGYDRIIGNPQYLLFGAGEFGLERFPGAVHEIHSTAGTIVFSYGLVGVLIFVMLFWLLYRKVGFAHLLYILPAFIYGGVHQGLRSTFLWILFGILVVAFGKCRVASTDRAPMIVRP